MQAPTVLAAPPKPPTIADPNVGKAANANRMKAALAAAGNNTVLTSPLGLTSPASTVKKTLLGA
jgi:hypothetical protein